jgi:hypothetical protein
MPNQDSPRLTKLKKGSVVKASSKWLTDKEGLNWYKVLAGGKFGFIAANNLETQAIKRELAGIKLESVHSDVSEIYSDSWNFVLRGMGTASSSLQSAFTKGTEWEFSYNLAFTREGIGRHLLSLGAAYINSSANNAITAGSLIVRIPVGWRLQPELRIRAGLNQSPSLMLGGALGVQYPFSRHYGTHFSGYGEGGAMLTVSSRLYYLYVAVGLGLHF